MGIIFYETYNRTKICDYFGFCVPHCVLVQKEKEEWEGSTKEQECLWRGCEQGIFRTDEVPLENYDTGIGIESSRPDIDAYGCFKCENFPVYLCCDFGGFSH